MCLVGGVRVREAPTLTSPMQCAQCCDGHVHRVTWGDSGLPGNKGQVRYLKQLSQELNRREGRRGKGNFRQREQHVQRQRGKAECGVFGELQALDITGA